MIVTCTNCGQNFVERFQVQDIQDMVIAGMDEWQAYQELRKAAMCSPCGQLGERVRPTCLSSSTNQVRKNTVSKL